MDAIGPQEPKQGSSEELSKRRANKSPGELAYPGIWVRLSTRRPLFAHPCIHHHALVPGKKPRLVCEARPTALRLEYMSRLNALQLCMNPALVSTETYRGAS